MTPIKGGATHVHPWTRGNRLIGYDPERIRIWVGGQRLHHGATGVVVAAAGLAGLAIRHTAPRRAVAYTLAGTALVAHDWKDRSAWFRGGLQSD